MKSDGFDDVPKNPFGVGHHVAVCYLDTPHKSRRAGHGSEGVRPTKSQLAVYNVKKKANKREREEFFELYQVVSARRYTIGTEKFWVLERGESRGFIPVVEGGKKRLNKKVDGRREKTNDPEGLCIYKKRVHFANLLLLLAGRSSVCVAMPYAYLVNALLI